MSTIMFPPPTNRTTKTASKPNRRLMLLVSAVVICAAVSLSIIFSSESDKGIQEEKIHRKPNRVKKVKPFKAIKKTTSSQRGKEEVPQLTPQRIGELRNGYRLLPSGRLHKVLGTIEIKDTSNSKLEKIFPEPADQLIAGLITIEPGDFLVGDSESFFKDFNSQFQAALKHEIEADDNDDEYARELKAMVKSTREELLQHKNSGHDLEQVMVETRQQLQELGLYRNELHELVKERLNNGDMTDGDYDDLLKAANLMLEERGVKPLELPQTFRHYINMMTVEPTNQ